MDYENHTKSSIKHSDVHTFELACGNKNVSNF